MRRSAPGWSIRCDTLSGRNERMRIAVISDIHGNLGALEAVLTDIDRQACDCTLNLGDIVSGPLHPADRPIG